MRNGRRSAKLRAAYVSFGRSTFDLQQATELVTASVDLLKTFDVSWHFVEGLITNVETARGEAGRLVGQVDVLVAQFTTFVDGRFIAAMAECLQVPVIAWAIREPNQQPGERLSLNSLTGANLAGRELYQRRIPFGLLYGSPADANFRAKLAAALRYWAAWATLQGFTVVTVGEAPDGFFFAKPGEQACRQLGIRIVHADLDETFTRAMALDDADVREEVARVKEQVRGLERLPPDNVMKFARMLTVLKQELAQQQAGAVAVRCWPEFFTNFGAAACSTVSALSEAGFMAACEADVLGALSMEVLHQLTGAPAYLGDLVELQPAKQAAVFWHCGAGAFSLARSDTGAMADTHPNRHIGFTLDFGLKPGKMTILRIGEDRDGAVRALVGRGEVLDEPGRFQGTSAVVRLLGEGDVVDRVTAVIEAGFEPHYALAYGDVANSLQQLLRQKGISVSVF